MLNPTSIERQYVNLCVRLFDEKNIAALKITHENKISVVDGTISLMEIITKWWKLVICQSCSKGIRLKDPFYDPILNITDNNVKFLQSFLEWLNLWENLSSRSNRLGKLTSDTQLSISHTTKTLILLIKYLFQKHDFQFVLLGTLQTDDFEARFGQYRQMSGAVYHTSISVTQILESERKLKMLSLINLESAMKGKLQLKEILISFRIVILMTYCKQMNCL